MPKHASAKTAKDAIKRIRKMVEERTKDPKERELLSEVLETPFKLLAQGQEELSLFIKYLSNPKASRSEVLTYLSNLRHCIGTSYSHIIGVLIPY